MYGILSIAIYYIVFIAQQLSVHWQVGRGAFVAETSDQQQTSLECEELHLDWRRYFSHSTSQPIIKIALLIAHILSWRGGGGLLPKIERLTQKWKRKMECVPPNTRHLK